MQLEVGSIVVGKVTGITNFGAFVDLPEGKTGMVHISEVASTYVNQISEHLSEGQEVKVKILSIGDDGKISLSIKKATAGDKPKNGDRPQQQRRGPRSFTTQRRPPAKPVTSPGDFEWQSSKPSAPREFEDMLSQFKQSSDEKISVLKKNSDVGARRPRRSSK